MVAKIPKIKKKSKQSSVKSKSTTKTQKIVLQPHQIEPTYKLLTRCPNQHGLLLYYNMGTGKTIAALAFVSKYPNCSVNIICPEEITFVWENEIKRMGIKNKVKYYCYEKIHNLFNRDSLKGELFILDEAQHIIPLIKESKGTISKVMSVLNSSYKTLILTGTPIYTGFSDLIYLTNIAAGKKILPYNDTDFMDKYYSVLKSRSFVFGHFFPVSVKLFDLLPKIFTGSTILSLLIGNYFQTSVSILDKINTFSQKPLIKINEYDSHTTIIMKTLSSPYIATALLGSVLGLIVFMTTLLGMKYKLEDYKKLNVSKLIKDINPYIIIHKNRYEGVDSPFPTFTKYVKEVSYSNYQLMEWLKLTQTRFDTKAIKNLQITNYNDVDYYLDKLDLPTYTKNGVIIGNLANCIEKINVYSPKFFKVLETAKGKRAVVYSSFTTNGILLFKEFLENQKVNHIYLDATLTSEQKNSILNKFKNSKVPIILLLNPKYTEGVSIFGAQQIHLLEPIQQLSKKQQVIARVIRYQSHAHLPVSQRHVDIYEWCCTVNNLLDKLRTTMFSLKTWIKFNPEVFFTEKFSKFEQDVTPDSIIIRNHEDRENELDEIDNELFRYQK